MRRKELKILMVVRGKLKTPTTGTEVFVKDLIRQMKSSGCDIDVICSGNSKFANVRDKVRYFNVAESSAPYLSSLYFMLEAKKFYVNYLKNNSYDYLITIGVGAITPIIFIGRGRIKSRIYYAIDTMIDEYGSKSSLLNIAQKINYQLKIFFDILAGKTADTVFCSSKKTLKTITEKYKVKKDKLRLFYFGLQDTKFSNLMMKTTIKAFDILLIATEHKRKGSMFFLKTLYQLKQDFGIEPESIIIGNSDEDLTKYIQEHRLKVKIVNKMSNLKLYEYYVSCKFLAVPSTSEGFCMPVIEAASVGRPSIVSRSGSLPEIVKDGITGYVSDLDINMFASKIKLMLNRSNWKKLGENAKANAQKYRISNTSLEIINFMKSQYNT